ncbi:MAG TPA: hypothetical protein VFY25_13235, partial [Anaerolineales bacterium]|nr:hypothetical protein [Anaerolineales bacterium]
MDTALQRWIDKQEKLKKQGQQPKLWELATLLQAYGFNRRKYPAPQKSNERERNKYYVAAKTAAPEQGYFKSFSIDTVLEYWKGVQPDLYNSLLGDSRNEPTGPEDLITILKAYGYNNEDYSYYRPGSKEIFGYAPGRDAQVIGKTHYLLAGVNIHGTTGRLQPRGVAHWVVVTRLTPQGNMLGDNGGWVEIYNPFPNEWEEYSYREFMKAFNGMSEGATLWIKKDVSPDFAMQALAPAKSKQKDIKSSGKGIKNAKSDQRSAKKRKEEKDKQRDKTKGKKGERVVEFDNEPPLDANELACERLGVQALPWAVGRWLLEASGGDSFLANSLTDALLECGILAIQEVEIDEKKLRAAVLTDLVSSKGLDGAIKAGTESPASFAQDPAYRVAGAVLPLFLPRIVEEIRELQKHMAFHAHQPHREFRAWTSGLAVQSLERLISQIQETVGRLPLAVHDREQLMRICNVILTRPTSGAIEEEIKSLYSNPAIMDPLNKVWDLKRGEKITLPQLREWIHGLAAPRRKDIYRVKRWGAPGAEELGHTVEKLYARGESSNFQAVGLYNEATGFGAVSNYLIIPREDVLRLEALQVEDLYEQKRPEWLHQKMNWLCQHRGSIYMFAEEEDDRGGWPWRREAGIRWGTIALGGNLVQVVEKRDMEVKLPAKEEVASMTMGRLRGFKREDWGRPLDELLAEGLVHRCFCVYTGNDIGDGPQGIVYSPFWSPEEWEFMPKTKGVRDPKALWIPMAYLEEESKEPAESPQADP